MWKWTIAMLLMTVGQLMAQMPTMMTREEAGQIALRIVQAGQFPTDRVYGLTSQELPAQREVMWDDRELQAFLAEEDKDYITMEWMSVSWFPVNSPFEDAYSFGVKYGPTGEFASVLVNAWTGFTTLEDARPENPLVTNTQLGLEGYPILSIEQQKERALEIVREVLGDGEFVVRFVYTPEDGDKIGWGEWGTNFLIYKIDPATGTHLLKSALLFINSRTGWLEEATIINRPTLVSTKPSISKKQAKTIALNYIQSFGGQFVEWVEDYHGGKIYRGTGLPYYADTGLFIVEDGLLEQHLIWMFVYVWAWEGKERVGIISVNAHTGVVMTDFTALLREVPERQRLNWQQTQTYEIFELCLNGKSGYLWWAPMQLVKGRVYIQEKYADNFGAKWDGNKLVGSRQSIIIKPSEKLNYKGQWYIPLRHICQVAGIRLWWDNERKVPVLRAEWLEAKRLLAKRANLVQ